MLAVEPEGMLEAAVPGKSITVFVPPVWVVVELQPVRGLLTVMVVLSNPVAITENPGVAVCPLGMKVTQKSWPFVVCSGHAGVACWATAVTIKVYSKVEKVSSLFKLLVFI